MPVNYKNHPTLSLLIQTGGWMEVNRVLASALHIFDNTYIYSAAIHGNRVAAPDEAALNKIVRPRKISAMNLLGYMDEIRRIENILTDLVKNTEGTEKYKNFDAACPEILEYAIIPSFLKDILDYLFETSIENEYYIFEADNFPFYKIKFKDKDTLVDFAQHCLLEGSIYKHIKNVTNDKHIRFVESDEFGEITPAKKQELLADMLRLMPFAVTLDETDPYLFHTPDDGEYLVFTEEEETAYILDKMKDYINTHNITETANWQTYCTEKGQTIPYNNIGYTEYFTDENYFDLKRFLQDEFENMCDILDRKNGIVIMSAPTI